MKIRTLIADDMQLARERIKMLLAADEEIEIVGECANGRQTVAAIKNLNPELVFLDMQMPKMSGLEVIEAVGVEQMPMVVFVTAYDEFALRAFEVNALDYLLKPFDDERFNKALERVKREIKQARRGDFDERLLQLLGEVKNKPEYLKRIPVKTAQYTILVLAEDIDFIKAAGNYLELHVGKDLYLIRERVHQFEQKLDPEQFVRIHRSTIVNIDRIKTLHPMFNGDHVVILRDGAKLNMSRTYHEKLLRLLR
jgi:two-component system, LytTR family, response regulator